jgi:hypothetical protein
VIYEDIETPYIADVEEFEISFREKITDDRPFLHAILEPR